MGSDMDNEDGPLELRADPRPVPPRFRKSRMWVAGVALIAFLLFSWYAYKQATRTGEQTVAPLIAADEQPNRAKPEEPGGMEIPHQDKSVYDRLGSQEPPPKVETLLPPPETPMAHPPASESPSSAAATPAAPASPGTETPPPPPAAASLPSASSAAPPAPSASSLEAPSVTPPAPPGESKTQSAAKAAPGGHEMAKVEPAAPAPAAPAAKTAPPAEEKQTAAATTPGAAAPKSAESGSYRVQLSSVKSEAAADTEWKRLQKTYSDLLGNLTLKVERADLGAKGTFYRVQAGSLSESAARDLCAELKKRNAGCLVVKP